MQNIKGVFVFGDGIKGQLVADAAGVVAGSRVQGQERVGRKPQDASGDGRRGQDGAARLQIRNVGEGPVGSGVNLKGADSDD